ncbi:MAG: NAD(P)-dependent oxidoreductase [Eubacteriales bacterium]|nr:NAD(P)-dependent oxidoreductase [Eubacteriales bacterium]
MRIAVTGASGFIGTEVTKKLETFPDTEIIAITRNMGHVKKNSGKYVWKETDFSVSSLREVLENVDVVIHLAAVRGTTGTISDYHINETITENLLVAMGEEKVKRIIFASSIAVYSDTETIPWREDNVIEPKTLYGITKASCEYLCRYYSKRYGFAYSIVRVAQVLGLGEKRKGMMNVFIETAYQHGQLHVMGKSIAKRQYIYVKDMAAVMCETALKPERESEIINAGMKKAYSNLEIAQIINKVFENETPIEYDSSFEEKIEPSKMEVTYLMDHLKFVPMDMEQVLCEVRKEIRNNPIDH